MTDLDLVDLGEDDHAVDSSDTVAAEEPRLIATPGRGHRWMAMLAYGLLPVLVVLLAAAAGYLKFLDGSVRDSQWARVQSVQAAAEGTVAMLSYKPDTVETDLGTARDRLAGGFRDSYTSLINDVVIPGAKQKQITSVATVAATSSVSATAKHAVVLIFVNQTITMGADAPSNTASAVRVTLDKTDGRWMISEFEPV